MTLATTAGSELLFVRVNVTAPFTSVSSPGFSVLSMTTGPFCPATCSWMWPMLMTVVAGQPVIVTSNFVLDPLNVTVAVPEQVASASLIGGFSFELLSSALKTFAGVGDGVGVGVGVGEGDGAAA